MPVRDGAMPPMLLFRSFLTTACGVVCQNVIVGAVTLVAAIYFFPEYLPNLALPNEAGELPPEVPMPGKMLFVVTAVSAVLCVLLGIFIGLTAPFGRLVHTIFLAVIVAVNYLSGSLASAPDKKFVTMTYLLVFPMAILLGGYLINRKMANYDSASREQPKMLGDQQ